MARKSGSTITQEELYPPSPVHSGDESSREYLDDARLVDLDADEESPFLRGQKRVSARRSSLPKKTASRLLWASIAAAVLCVATIIAAALYQYGEHSWRFRVESSDNIEVTGMQNVTKAQIMEVMGADIGRNIFFVPLAQQKTQLEQIPWVESASVMRFVPNRLKVEIHERTPVAFARVGPRISLIDAGGTLMDLPRKDQPQKDQPQNDLPQKDLAQRHKYSFPVILGMNPGEPLSTRAPRMRAYNDLVQELDSGGARYSQDLSEVDLSDLDNLKVRVNDPAGDVQVELGSSDYLKRYKTYVSHVQEWRQQFQRLESVNLRYDNQVIVNPDMVKPGTPGKPKQAALTLAVSKAAVAAGVKPAALITRVGPHERPLPKPAFELTEKKLDPKAAAAKKPAKPKAKKASAKVAKRAAAKPAAKTPAATKPAGAIAHATPQKPEVKKVNARNPPQTAPTAAVNAIPKPSAAITKPQAITGTNN